jgi:hypothetical protein
MHRFIVDTLATIIFFTLIATLTELFVAGMEPSEVLMRDGFFKKTKPTISWSKVLIDGLAFLSFQLPIYALTLVIAGADQNEVIILLTSTSFLMFIVSRPFGVYLEAVGTWANATNSQKSVAPS